jgi:23S rRNA (cytosine1962-C5)-methyltransferase
VASVRDWPQVRLASDELLRGPWVYGRQVDRSDGTPDGALVEVLDASGRFVGHALYNGASDIRLRWLSRGRKTALARPADFLAARLKAADDLRRRTLRLEDSTDAYRVCHAEGDDLPGLIVDRLGQLLVVELHALGFLRLLPEVRAGLERLYPGFPIVARVPAAAQRAERIDPGELPTMLEGPEGPEGAHEVWIRENGLTYPVLAAGGHKTGWFCDQRDNRPRIGALAAGRRVLDLFCNTGGFALHCARAGARTVSAVDLDEKALERARRAGEANGLAVTWRHADAFDVLRETAALAPSEQPDLVICDPHKLIASRAQLETGRRKYADLFALALAATRPGGLLAAFSCSGALSLEQFLGLLFGAARRARSEVRLLTLMEAAPDHPQRPDWPRSRYLKGALLALDR